jgi:vacuolar-type H+-ATPase subunit I/STV1
MSETATAPAATAPTTATAVAINPEPRPRRSPSADAAADGPANPRTDGSPDSSTALTQVAGELYGLLPAEFTAARNRRAKAAVANGDKELARQITGFPKPSTSAWAVNMLVRHRRAEIDPLLELGASLQEAQEDLDSADMRELSRQRYRVIAAVTAEARAVAEELGQRVSESAAAEIAQTLQAAMSDPDAAAALESGTLVRPLSSTGFEPVDLDDAVAVPLAPGAGDRFRAGAARIPGRFRSKPGESKTGIPAPPSKKELAEARRAVEVAEHRSGEATTTFESLENRIADVQSNREQLSTELDELKERLADLQRELASLDRESEELRRDRTAARHSVEEAEKKVAAARRRLEDLRDAMTG